MFSKHTITFLVNIFPFNPKGEGGGGVGELSRCSGMVVHLRPTEGSAPSQHLKIIPRQAAPIIRPT